MYHYQCTCPGEQADDEQHTATAAGCLASCHLTATTLSMQTLLLVVKPCLYCSETTNSCSMTMNGSHEYCTDTATPCVTSAAFIPTPVMPINGWDSKTRQLKPHVHHGSGHLLTLTTAVDDHHCVAAPYDLVWQGLHTI
eukprot:GHRR01027219.1.p1 GENE.GHRR01027219.1~~GHRR01027219.1.p1  ORF type:complete len:139 (-),score=12.79 GHRR01027219.1:160-576(-)